MQYFTLEKIGRLLTDIQSAIHREVIPIPTLKFYEGDLKGAEAINWDDSGWVNFSLPGYWGGYDKFAWFRTQVQIPAHFRGHKTALRFLIGPRDGYGSTAETMLYVNGHPLQGIDYWHEEAVVPAFEMETGTLHIALRAWSGVLNTPPRRNFKLAQLNIIDIETEKFYHLSRMIALSLPLLDENDLRRVKLLNLLNRAFARVDFVRIGTNSFYESVCEALKFLESGLIGLQRDEIKPRVIGVGHSHIDLAWLWRMERTREKAERTFTTVLNLMDQYPEFRYAHSTPQLYDFVRRDYPDLYAKIKTRVKEGCWEVLGASWVEMDTLIPSGESLVRQVLFGKRFSRSEFGVDPKVLWLPDSFGFSGLLPTILRGADIEGFFTAVVSYSKFNRFPYDTFRWRAPDGSEVLVNFITTPAESGKNYNYIGRLEPFDTQQTWNNNRQKEYLQEVLLPFGWGDGGGGPTVQMLEQARALKNLPGIPYVEVGKVEPFFSNLQQQVQAADLPLVDGEIYLENLRGAYTSQARTKRANRKAETLYHDAEWMCVLADVLTGEQHYPKAMLNTGWKIILRNQFHDIVAGTSIPEVHADALAEFDMADEIGRQAIASVKPRLFSGLRSSTPGLMAMNPTGWVRSGLVELPWIPEYSGKIFLDPEGVPLPVQRSGTSLLVQVQEVPALGYRFFPQKGGMPPVVEYPVKVAGRLMENRFFRLVLDENGAIASLRFGTDGREVLSGGLPGNQLQFFEDRPLDGEAWQIEPFYQEKQLPPDALLETVVEDAGPLRGVIRHTWRFNYSTIIQRTVIYAHSPRIDFVTELDWHEHQVMLKAAFPVDVRARQATYDLGFAALERPTHWNTPFDAAHFENPLQQWVDLSEPDFGAALLNDCKYGCDVKDNTLRLTLHRSPTNPDPTADQGRHLFTYSLLVHTGNWQDGSVPRQGRELNDPLQAFFLPANPEGTLPGEFSLVSTTAENVVIETVKQAEDGEAWIVRLFEAYQTRGPVRLEFGLPLKQAAACNLLEEELHTLEVFGGTVVVNLQPFEIKTLKVRFL